MKQDMKSHCVRTLEKRINQNYNKKPDTDISGDQISIFTYT